MRLPAMLFTPIPPMETGLSTYAVRVIQGTSATVEWTVAYPEGGDPDSLPAGVSAIRIDSIHADAHLPEVRIFNIGNSLDCLPVVRALYAFKGTSLLHETVLHHLHRYGWERIGMREEYHRELQFSYGPSAGRILKLLDRPGRSESEYDILLKRYPLIGRVLHHSESAAVLNGYSLSMISGAFPPDRVMTVGHPLSALPQLDTPSRPFGFTVLMAGGCHPGRNLGSVVSAMERFRLEAPDAGLLLLGGGYPEELPEWVLSMGRLPEKEYQEWIRTADAAVDFRHPTCGETSGSLLEIQRAGVPCITSDSGAYAYLPSEGLLRVPVSSGSDGIAAALSYLHRLPDTGKSIGAMGAAYAEETGSTERMISDWEALLRMAAPVRTDTGSKDRSCSPVSLPWSLSAAWHPVPAGFERSLRTAAVSWKFSGTAGIQGPRSSDGASITAWGRGTVNGVALPDNPETIEVPGSRLDIHGEGWVTGVRWFRTSAD